MILETSILSIALLGIYGCAWMYERLNKKHNEMRQAVECARCKWMVI